MFSFSAKSRSVPCVALVMELWNNWLVDGIQKTFTACVDSVTTHGPAAVLGLLLQIFISSLPSDRQTALWVHWDPHSIARGYLVSYPHCWLPLEPREPHGRVEVEETHKGLEICLTDFSEDFLSSKESMRLEKPSPLPPSLWPWVWWCLVKAFSPVAFLSSTSPFNYKMIPTRPLNPLILCYTGKDFMITSCTNISIHASQWWHML